jgi:hypothetical protein
MTPDEWAAKWAAITALSRSERRALALAAWDELERRNVPLIVPDVEEYLRDPDEAERRLRGKHAVHDDEELDDDGT